MTATTPDVDLETLLADDREGARVALLNARHDPISETLTATARPTTRGTYLIVHPRLFTFTHLQAAVVTALGLWIGDWTGTIPLPPRPLRPGDTYHLHLPNG